MTSAMQQAKNLNKEAVWDRLKRESHTPIWTEGASFSMTVYFADHDGVYVDVKDCSGIISQDYVKTINNNVHK